MKLYATIKNERGGKKGTGDDTRILIELSYGNKVVGEIGLYAIIDNEKEGYRIVFKDDTNNIAKVIKEVEKGKTQNDKVCKHGQPQEICATCQFIERTQ